jgi:hypothetical protein
MELSFKPRENPHQCIGTGFIYEAGKKDHPNDPISANGQIANKGPVMMTASFRQYIRSGVFVSANVHVI